MKIELSVFSVMSIALILAGIITGSPIQLYSLEVSVSDKITVDPVFVIWSQSPLLPESMNGYALGNIVVFDAELRDRPFAHLGIQHELNHILQQRALGLLTPFLFWLGADLEGQPLLAKAEAEGSPEIFKQSIDSMFIPDLPPAWHFLSIDI